MQSGNIIIQPSGEITAMSIQEMTTPTPRDFALLEAAVLANNLVYVSSELWAKDYTAENLLSVSTLAIENSLNAIMITIQDKIDFNKLIMASKSGDESGVENYLNQIGQVDDIFKKDIQGMTALDWSIKNGNLNIVEILFKTLKKNCNLHTQREVKDWNLIWLAAINSQFLVVQYLLNQCKDLKTLEDMRVKANLQIATLSMVTSLLENINNRIKTILDHINIVLAAKLGKVALIKEYIEAHGIRIVTQKDVNDQTVLTGAALYGQLNTILYILFLDTDSKIEAHDYIDAIRSAAKYGHVSVVSCLLHKVTRTETLREIIKMVIAQEGLSYAQGLEGCPQSKERIQGNPEFESQLPNAPDLSQASQIKEIYPSIRKFINARINEINKHAPITLRKYFTAVKYSDSSTVSSYIQNKKKQHADNKYAVESIVRLGLLIAAINRNVNMALMLLAETNNVIDIRYAYFQLPEDELVHENPSIASLFHQRLLALNYDYLATPQSTFSKIIDSLENDNFKVIVPDEYLDPVMRHIMGYPITIGRYCTSAKTYDLATMVRYFLAPETTPTSVACPLTRAPIKINELLNGLRTDLLNSVENFVIHEVYRKLADESARIAAEAAAASNTPALSSAEEDTSESSKRKFDAATRDRLFSRSAKRTKISEPTGQPDSSLGATPTP